VNLNATVDVVFDVRAFVVRSDVARTRVLVLSRRSRGPSIPATLARPDVQAVEVQVQVDDNVDV